MDADSREPWAPPGHLERLTVGARVRIVDRGECMFCAAIRLKGGPNLTGQTGRIEFERWPSETFREYGHPYLVRLDEPFPDTDAPNGYWLLTHHAAAELIPLDGAPSAEDTCDA